MSPGEWVSMVSAVLASGVLAQGIAAMRWAAKIEARVEQLERVAA